MMKKKQTTSGNVIPNDFGFGLYRWLGEELRYTIHHCSFSDGMIPSKVVMDFLLISANVGG